MIGNMKWKKTAARWFAGEESGQGLVEYGLIIVLIAIAVITALKGIATALDTKFQEVSDTLQ